MHKNRSLKTEMLFRLVIPLIFFVSIVEKWKISRTADPIEEIKFLQLCASRVRMLDAQNRSMPTVSKLYRDRIAKNIERKLLKAISNPRLSETTRLSFKAASFLYNWNLDKIAAK